MPNDYENTVEIRSTPEKIKELIQKTELILDPNIEKNQFDFNGIIPMPDDIFRGNLSPEDAERTKGHNWRDWSIENWGTKWPAYDIEYVQGTETTIVLRFNTAWSMPKPVFEELENQGYEVNAMCYDPGNDGFHYYGEDRVYDVFHSKIIYTPLEDDKITKVTIERIPDTMKALEA